MAGLREVRTLADLVRRHAAERPAATATIFGARAMSYAQLDGGASRVANALAALGVRGEDRIGYLGKNSDFFFELLFGAAKAAAVLVPVNWRLAPPEMAAILRDAGVCALFVGRGFGPVAAGLRLPGDIALISMDGAGPDWPDYADWRDRAPETEPALPARPDDTALQLYTSGTTGLPKGVELTHENLLAMVDAIARGGPGAVGPDDTILVAMPVFHIAGTLLGLIGFAGGSAALVTEEYDPARVVEDIPRHRVTATILVPAAILMLVRHPAAAAADFGSVRILMYGASPIAEALVHEARAMFPRAGLFHLYGLTEASGGGTILPPAMHDPALGKLRSCGKPYPGFEVRVVDPLGAPVPAGTVGEIVVRSPTVMKGYWNNPEATRATFFAGGWLRTGDAGYVDEDGFFYVHDRVKDMIVTGGENVYPAEVENALFAHAAVGDVAVIGVPDARWGEAVKAVVVLRPDAAATAEELIAHARGRIAGFKLPKSVDFVAALPRNPSGKVLRRELRAPYWAGYDRRVN